MPEPNQRTSPLYDPRFEHDACGIGAVVDLRGEKTYQSNLRKRGRRPKAAPSMKGA